MKQPRTFTPLEKAQVALATIQGDKTIAQISSTYQIHPTQIRNWTKQAKDNFVELFKDSKQKEKLKKIEQQRQINNLYKIIGQRDTELDWLKKNYQFLTHNNLISIIDKGNKNRIKRIFLFLQHKKTSPIIKLQNADRPIIL
ncbi:transposase [Patescibacteria group bacterium]|nr:transposase [Patescibacteria group bacterium]